MNRIKTWSSRLTLAVAVVVFSHGIAADDSASEQADGDQDRFRRDLQQYNIQLETEPAVRPELHSTPVLRWSNPARFSEEGAVFVWLHDGRPEVISTAFTWQSRDGLKKKHSFQSLALAPILASLNDRVVWHPKEPGIAMRPVPDSAKPAETQNLRMVQMRSIARRFTVELTQPGNAPTALRLVPRPLYRYGSPEADVLDGGLYSFAAGTDPEAILVIEARRNGDAMQWHYALARFNYWALRATYDNQEVWSAERITIEGKTIEHALVDPRMRDRTYISYSVPDSPD